MGNHDRKKKRHDSSSSKSSDSNSDLKDENKKSESDFSPEYSKKTSHKPLKRKSVSSSDEEIVKRNKSSKREDDRSSRIDKMKKSKFEDPQKSKWDSPADNASKSLDRKKDKETYNRRSLDRDEPKEHRKHHDRYKHERREDNKNRNYHRHGDNKNRHENDRGDRKDRGRLDRRDNDTRYKSGRQKSRDRSRSREDPRRDDHKREDTKFRNRRNQRRSDNSDHENYDWGKKTHEEKKPPADKEKPNFGLSGKLTEETNTYRGVLIKYSEPPEARKPKRRWRLYPFKGEKALPTLYIHRESAYLMGRDRKVVDFPLDHPSCSKQHAVLQYRLVPFTRDDGSMGKRVRPYLIDLDSANGTFINNKRIDARKYVELLEKDVIKFGYSSREYVLLHENSKDEGLDDDVKPEDDEVVLKEEPEES